MTRPSARPRALTAAGLAVAVVLLAGCSSGASTADAPAATSATTTAAASTSAAGTAAVTAKAACTAYAAGTGNPRQVVLSASRNPVRGAGVALVTINFRDTVAALDVPSDPQLSAAFTEVVAALDQLTQQLADGLPEGADVNTRVRVDPSRLKAALDAADSLCSARGVAPKADTATTADPSATVGAAPTS